MPSLDHANATLDRVNATLRDSQPTVRYRRSQQTHDVDDAAPLGVRYSSVGIAPWLLFRRSRGE